MKTIGILGGMAWPSTVDYYRIINQKINEKLGGNNSAKVIIHSPNFADIEKMQNMGKWSEMGKMLGENAAKHLNGADFIIIATNTMHKVAGNVEDISGKMVLHIADATAKEIIKNNIIKVALLGTKFTMQEDFYKEKLKSHGIETVIPEDKDITIVNSIIYDELVKGIITYGAKQSLIRIIDNLAKNYDCKGVILGCTELPLLFPDEASVNNIPLFKTADIHAEAAAIYALE